MTEKEIRKIVEESIKETLKKMGVLNEMSVPLKNYKSRVDGLRFQMVENWCLCKYCTLFDKDNINFSHWLSELKACINNLKYLEIKKGIDKRKTLINMLVRDYDYDKPNMIYRIINDKFNKEEIKEDTQKVKVSCEFADGINELINVISFDHLSTSQYLEKNFP